MLKKGYFVIAGLGKTGLSTARYLHRKNIPFIMMDSRENPPYREIIQKDFPDITLYLGGWDFNLLEKAVKIILSPGLVPDIFFRALNREKITSDIELFLQKAKVPVIGITGTNAKGTVTTLLSEMIKLSGLEVLTGGNIGTPALELLEKPTPDFYVLEISSFQLEISREVPLKVAAILNITPDHLDRHGNMQNYQQIKQHIYQAAEIIIFNRDDQLTFPLKTVSDFQKLYSFGLSAPLTKTEFGLKDQFLAKGLSDECFNIQHLALKGKHNWLNALAALTIGDAIGLAPKKMYEALKTFSGLPHRCEWLGSKHQVHWFNDSKATNIGATLAALKGLGETLENKAKIILIAGGKGKKQNFTLLKPTLQRYTRYVILIGEDAYRINDMLAKDQDISADHPENLYAVSLAEAVDIAHQKAQKNDIVLLSPACASFDMFKDFEDRGNQFRLLVKNILHS